MISSAEQRVLVSQGCVKRALRLRLAACKVELDAGDLRMSLAFQQSGGGGGGRPGRACLFLKSLTKL